MVDKILKPKFIPFTQRDGGLWNDLEPVEQYEGGRAPICPIAYTNEYEEIMGYFRAVLVKNELSHRAYDLCAEVLKHNAGDYHAWGHRRRCIDALGIPYGKELAYINSVGIALEKNFQIWHHRRCIMEMHQGDFE